ncbi:MAG: AMP-binding protein [Desulfobacterales bacterium]|nr:AMP-binding protein [Desulfobacterales bacterium]
MISKSVKPLISTSSKNFDEAYAEFEWQLPSHFNIAESVCDRHRDLANRIAMLYENERGETAQYTFGQLRKASNQLANALAAQGIGEGDRVAIVLPQRIETGISHLALYKLKAIAVPLSGLFGSDALSYRLRDSGAKLIITDTAHRESIESLKAELPDLEDVLDVDANPGFWDLLESASDEYKLPHTPPDTPALLIYTSGTTGPAKGATVAHRCFYGNLTGFELSHDFFGQKYDLFWTPADWAWTGGLVDALLPAWYYGKPILAYEGGKFDPEKTCYLLDKYQVRNGFVPPTALKMLRQVETIQSHYNINFRSIMSAGEALGAELYHWGQETLGIKINEMWGQTEFNYIAGSCSALMEPRPGSMGKPYPGHRVDVIDQAGNTLPQGETGELVAHTDDPVMFLGYWNKPEATAEKIINSWWRTGDSGYKDDDGYIWFVGRNDDVISSAGHRIGPGEIEDVLMSHPAVMQAAVIGKPDELRGEIVKAFILTSAGTEQNESLKNELKQHVKSRLAAHEYPREIEFIDELPMTTTGKVRRIELRNHENKLN